MDGLFHVGPGRSWRTTVARGLPVLMLCLLVAPAHAQAPNTPPAGYALCAAERAVCSFSGTATVVYGSGTRWTAPRNFTASVTCNNATFGDPTPFVAKACYQKAAEPNLPPAGFTLCASEGGPCTFSGSAQVVYGARTTWTAPRTLTSPLTCRNATFGMDPLPFVVKACYQKAIATSPPVPLNVRVQGLTLGGTLRLGHGNASLEATFNNQPYAFTSQVAAGSPLDLRVLAQPQGQRCTVSELAPATVPADGAPVFVRCRQTSAPRVVLPETLPNAPLAVSFGVREAAYPGLPYESRPGVVGGIFPYQFSLQSVTFNGAAQGLDTVALDARQGTLRFTPGAEGRYAITVEVRDSGATQKVLTHTFEITAAASRFVFVSPDGADSPGRGGRATPYRTLAHAIEQASADQVLMLRRGTYLAAGVKLYDNRAKQLLAYPDEVVTLDMASSGDLTARFTGLPMGRVEGFDIVNVRQYGIVSDPSIAGLVIRHVRFVNGVEGPNISENPAFIHGWGGDTTPYRHKLLIQENDFGRYVGAGYATTLFNAGYSLIEDNQVRLGAGVNGGFHDKDHPIHNTYRRNYLEFTDADRNSSSGIQMSAQHSSEHVHVHHNLIVNGGVLLGTQCVQDDCFMHEHNVHHNTLVGGGIGQSWGVFQPLSGGTRVSHNIIASREQPAYGGLSCVRGRPAGFTTQMTTATNFVESSHPLAHRDFECSEHHYTWSEWRAFGRDTAASGSVVTATPFLTGSGITTGLPAGDSRWATFGHLYP